MADLYDFTDYKSYLNEKLDNLDSGGRGSRARMSRSIGCQTAYTAQVLRGRAHFSLEQAEGINSFLGHTEEQGHYFLLLIQLAKAGVPKLKDRFQKQIELLQQDRTLLKNRLGVDQKLAKLDQAIYYSSWVYGAIHALISVPGFQSPEAIAKRLGIGVRKATEAVEFLLFAGLIERSKNGSLRIGNGQIHLAATSPLIAKHHLNWRLQAMQAIEYDPQLGLHYSSVVSISRSDEKKIYEMLVATLKEIKATVKVSKEEEVASLSIDFFPVQPQARTFKD